MTKFECAAVVVLLIVVPIGGYGLVHFLLPELVAAYDGGWLGTFFKALSGFSYLYDALTLLLLLVIALCFVLVELEIIAPRKEDEKNDR